MCLFHKQRRLFHALVGLFVIQTLGALLRSTEEVFGAHEQKFTRVSELFAKYPGLWGELSYRSGITDGAGRLTGEWRALFERYPDRFLLGSDTWVPERWTSYSETMAGYRAWLGQLPPKIAAQIANGNAKALFATK